MENNKVTVIGTIVSGFTFRSALADESIDQVSVALIVGKELFVTDVRTWNCAQVHTSFAQESEHAKWTT